MLMGFTGPMVQLLVVAGVVTVSLVLQLLSHPYKDRSRVPPAYCRWYSLRSMNVLETQSLVATLVIVALALLMAILNRDGGVHSSRQLQTLHAAISGVIIALNTLVVLYLLAWMVLEFVDNYRRSADMDMGARVSWAELKRWATAAVLAPLKRAAAACWPRSGGGSDSGSQGRRSWRSWRWAQPPPGGVAPPSVPKPTRAQRAAARAAAAAQPPVTPPGAGSSAADKLTAGRRPQVLAANSWLFNPLAALGLASRENSMAAAAEQQGQARGTPKNATPGTLL